MLTPASPSLEQAGEFRAPDAAADRLALFAFFVCGISMSFLGAILPAWRYHLVSGFMDAANYFLSLALGIVGSAATARLLLPRKGPRFVFMAANILACGGFLFLAFSSPPAPHLWRLFGVFWIGMSTGLLSAATFQTISPAYGRNRGATTNVAGVLFGSGCLVTALLVAGTYYVYTVPSILIFMALVPGFSAGLYAKLPGKPSPPLTPLSQVWRDLKNPGAILFGLLLFFQFGNEWAIAGWLPLFLIRRLGISPETSLLILALYWGALLVGRILSQLVIDRISRAALLVGSILSALFGTAVLASTNNGFGAVMGVLFVGAGYASIYPLVVQKIGHRFPNYHADVFNWLFSLAMTGGLLAPWSLGFFATRWGVEGLMIVPMLGTIMVFLLILLILLDAKLSSLTDAKEARS